MKYLEINIRVPVSHAIERQIETNAVETERLQDGNVRVEIHRLNRVRPGSDGKRDVAKRKNRKRIDYKIRTAIREFIAIECEVQNGAEIAFGEFHEQFCETSGLKVDKKTLTWNLPDEHPSKHGTHNKCFVRNIRWRDRSNSTCDVATAVSEVANG